MGLPGMTEEIADCILDFLDEDDEARPYGAESEYYSQLPSPYAAVNGPLHSVDELLLVKGVTPLLLFGLDQNRNGVVDGSESQATMMGATGSSTTTTSSSSLSGNSESESPPSLGWSQYLTLFSREKNTDSTGLPRVNLNSTDLQQLQADLDASLSNTEWSSFILAYRIYGPSANSGANNGTGAAFVPGGNQGGGPGRGQGGNGPGGNGQGGGPGRGGNGPWR